MPATTRAVRLSCISGSSRTRAVLAKPNKSHHSQSQETSADHLQVLHRVTSRVNAAISKQKCRNTNNIACSNHSEPQCNDVKTTEHRHSEESILDNDTLYFPHTTNNVVSSTIDNSAMNHPTLAPIALSPMGFMSSVVSSIYGNFWASVDKDIQNYIMSVPSSSLTHSGYEVSAVEQDEHISVLQMVDLSHTFMTANSVPHVFCLLKKLLSDADVETLAISSNNLEESGCAQIIAHGLILIPQLRTIEMFQCGMTDKNLHDLTDYIRQSSCNISRLKIGDNKITSLGVLSLTGYYGLDWPKKLTQCHLGGNRIGDEGAALLGMALAQPHCSLTHISLRDIGISLSGLHHLARGITANPTHLRELQLRDNVLGEHDGLHIASVIRACEHLDVLDIANIGAGGSTLKLVFETITSTCRKVRELNLSRNHIDRSAVEALRCCMTHRRACIATLDLSNCGLPPSSIVTVMEGAICCKSLSQLNLAFNDLSRNGASALALYLSRRSRIQSVNVIGCRMEGCDVGDIFEALSLNRCPLRSLFISQNNAGDVSANSLCTLFARNTLLSRIEFQDNGIRSRTSILSILHSLRCHNATIRNIRFGGQSDNANFSDDALRVGFGSVMTRNRSNVYSPIIALKMRVLPIIPSISKNEGVKSVSPISFEIGACPGHIGVAGLTPYINNPFLLSPDTRLSIENPATCWEQTLQKC